MRNILPALVFLLVQTPARAQVGSDAIRKIVVTGTRHADECNSLSQTVAGAGREQIEQSLQPSLLPTLVEQVPGLFATARDIMGGGVSDGSADAVSPRGLCGGGSRRLLVLIDGHPQYMGLMGHPIADVCQSYLAERVEVLRGLLPLSTIPVPWGSGEHCNKEIAARQGADYPSCRIWFL